MCHKEKWCAIPGFPGYEVSDLGRVRSWRAMGPGIRLAARSRPVRTVQQRSGYVTVCLRLEGKRYSRYVHRLVLQAFVGPGGSDQRDHINHDRSDNRLTNLRWLARTDNMRRRRATRLGGRVVSKIRERYAAGEVLQKDLAREFGVSPSHVSKVLSGDRWRVL